MKSSWSRVAWQWILVICCALSVTVPVPALCSFLVQAIGTVQVQDERETETVKTEASASDRRLEGRRLVRPAQTLVLSQHSRPKASSCGLDRDGRLELKSRCLSLRC